MSRDYSRAKSMYDNVISFHGLAEDYATFQVAMIAGVRSSNEKISLMNTMARKFPTSSLVGDANMEIANATLPMNVFVKRSTPLNNVLKLATNNSLKPQAQLKLAIANYNLNNNRGSIGSIQNMVQTYPNSS
jgi:outer membrane protein assembly factor BamD (BamD/ComL family)